MWKCVTWTGYVDARRYALGRVTTPYAFMLDADELLSDDLRAALTGELSTRRRLSRAPRDDARRPRRARRGLVGGDGSCAASASSARASSPTASAARADLHERWIVDGTRRRLPGMIVHDSYPTRRVVSRTLRALHAHRGGGARRIAARVRRRARRNFRCASRWWWLRYGAWRDGWRGAFVAWYSALYPLAVQWRALRSRDEPRSRSTRAKPRTCRPAC